MNPKSSTLYLLIYLICTCIVMAQTILPLCVCALLFLSVVVADGTPKAKKVRCKDKNFPDCYKTQLLCPDSCLRTCELDCASCQPVCNASLPLTPAPKPLKAMKVRCKDKKFRPGCFNQQFLCPGSCPRSCEVDCASCQPVCKVASPVATPPPPPPQSEVSPAKAFCKNKLYPQCYRQEQNCPSACPDHCEVDCVTCSPVCGKLLLHSYVNVRIYNI